MDNNEPRTTAVFDLHTIANNFPSAAKTMLNDTRLTDEKAASARVFRVYRPLPRDLRRVSSGRLWPGKVLPRQRRTLRTRPRPTCLLQARHRSRRTRDPRRALRYLPGAHASPRPQRHSPRESSGRHRGNIHRKSDLVLAWDSCNTSIVTKESDTSTVSRVTIERHDR